MVSSTRPNNSTTEKESTSATTTTTTTPGSKLKGGASWIKSQKAEPPRPTWQKANGSNSNKFLDPGSAGGGGIFHAKSESDLTKNVGGGKKLGKDQQQENDSAATTLGGKCPEFTSSEWLSLEVESDEDDETPNVTVTIVPKPKVGQKPFPDNKLPMASSLGPTAVQFENEAEELKNWSLSGNEREDLRNKLSNVLGRRSASRSPAPSSSPGPTTPLINLSKDKMPKLLTPTKPDASKPRVQSESPSRRKMSVEKTEEGAEVEHAVKPSAVKATQPKMTEEIPIPGHQKSAAAASASGSAPKNMSKEALMNQFNAMWEIADDVPEVEIIKCGLPEAKAYSDPENNTDCENCIQRLLSNDPELTEINLNNMKRTPVPQIQRLLEALHNNQYFKKLSLANLGLRDSGLEPLLNALEANTSLKVLNLETNFLSGDFLARVFQALLKTQTLEEIKAVNQSVTMGNQAEMNIMKAIHQNRGLWKVSLSLRVPEAKQKIDQALIRNGELRRLKRQIEAMGGQMA